MMTIVYTIVGAIASVAGYIAYIGYKGYKAIAEYLARRHIA